VVLSTLKGMVQMISAWHLLWIIPVSAWFGYALACFMWAAKENDRD
jgi:hypothetical protein